AANMSRTRCRLSATWWGFVRLVSVHAAEAAGLAIFWSDSFAIVFIADMICIIRRHGCHVFSNHAKSWKGVAVETPIWINGQIKTLADASIGVEDRGYQFADGIYEVVRFYNGKLFTLREHMERLARSAEGLRLQLPVPAAQIGEELRKFV